MKTNWAGSEAMWKEQLRPAAAGTTLANSIQPLLVFYRTVFFLKSSVAERARSDREALPTLDFRKNTGGVSRAAVAMGVDWRGVIQNQVGRSACSAQL